MPVLLYAVSELDYDGKLAGEVRGLSGGADEVCAEVINATF